MKNLFLSIVLLLTVSFAFANGSSTNVSTNNLTINETKTEMFTTIFTATTSIDAIEYSINPTSIYRY